MLKAFKDRLGDWLDLGNETELDENSSLIDLSKKHPHLIEFVERRYGIKVDSGEHALSLSDFGKKHGLPPSAILFAEIQTLFRTQQVQSIDAKRASALMANTAGLKILDVREEWERKICALPESHPLTPQLLDELLQGDRNVPILIYCHFGIRALDAGTFLADRGFSEVYVLEGGIDGFAKDVDASIPRYENAWC